MLVRLNDDVIAILIKDFQKDHVSIFLNVMGIYYKNVKGKLVVKEYFHMIIIIFISYDFRVNKIMFIVIKKNDDYYYTKEVIVIIKVLVNINRLQGNKEEV